MYAEGYRNITNIDISEIVVEDMQLKYKNSNIEDSFKCNLPIMKMFMEMLGIWRIYLKINRLIVWSIKGYLIVCW